MTKRLPPLNALRAFEAAARLGSFSSAAESLHVTHGAISRQVRNLEQWLGVAVFERAGRRVRLTTEGRDYLHAIQSAFDAIATATQRLSEVRTRRRIAIDALPTFTMRWLLPRLARFPLHSEVELRIVTSDRPLSGAADGFDVAIRRGPEDWPGCVAQEFLVEHDIPVCSPVLLKRVPLKDVRDLARHTLLYSDTRPNAWERWLTAAGAPDLKIKSRQQFDHFYLTLQAAADGLGVALGPRPIIDEEISAGRLAAPLAGPAVRSRAYWWVMPNSRAGDPVLRAFCDWLAKEAGGVREASLLSGDSHN
jgi:LysR family transcriptional regulator, glycine cleavage system transcriptional activator